MRWREIGPYLRELWHRPAGPMNWKNPIRVFAVVGWLVVQGFVLLGWAGFRLFSRFPASGVGRVARQPIRRRASAAATLFLRRFGVGRMELCTPSPSRRLTNIRSSFWSNTTPQISSMLWVVWYYVTALRCRHAQRLYFRHHLEGLAGRAAKRFRIQLQAPAVAA